MSDLEQLQRDVQYLLDRTAITDCIAAHARGCDRHDVELLTSTYFDDGVDVHGATVNAGGAYARWANEVHAATSQNHLHHVTTHSCEIDGDVAHAESYVMVTLLSPDATSLLVQEPRERLGQPAAGQLVAPDRRDAALTVDHERLGNPARPKRSHEVLIGIPYHWVVDVLLADELLGVS